MPVASSALAANWFAQMLGFAVTVKFFSSQVSARSMRSFSRSPRPQQWIWSPSAVASACWTMSLAMISEVMPAQVMAPLPCWSRAPYPQEPSPFWPPSQ